MSHVQWCIGNTTLREASRLKEALRILKGNFDGKEWSYQNQKLFLDLLCKAGFYEAGEMKSDKQKEQHGRSWGSAFNELGFATCYKRGNKYVKSGVKITEAGNALLSEKYVEEDVWLRQLLKLQFPSSLPQKTESQYKGFSLLPLQALLMVMRECDGITKDEGFLINTLKANKEVKSAIQSIKAFRMGMGKIKSKGRNAVRKFVVSQQAQKVMEIYEDDVKERLQLIKKFFNASRDAEKNVLNDIVRGGKGSNTAGATRLKSDLVDLKRHGAPLSALFDEFVFYYGLLKSRTWKDYLDATARYVRMSGIVTVHRAKLVLAESHMEIADWILKQKWVVKTPKEYLKYLHDPALPELPQDKATYLKTAKQKVIQDIDKLEKLEKVEIKAKLKWALEQVDDPLVMRKQLLSLSVIRRELKEYEYMMKLHSADDSISEIVDYFSAIKNREVIGHMPAHFEWNVWRGFLAIDKLSKAPHECRNFDIDEELQPKGHAPGNRPDMVFYYDDFILVVEVTLLTGETQYSAEHEPVPRHVVRVMEQEDGNVYSIFIAPQINLNTSMHFHAKMTNTPHINSKGEKVYPKIIPLSVDEYISLLNIYNEKRYSPSQLKALLDMIISAKDSVSVGEGDKWAGSINESIKKWSKTL